MERDSSKAAEDKAKAVLKTVELKQILMMILLTILAIQVHLTR